MDALSPRPRPFIPGPPELPDSFERIQKTIRDLETTNKCLALLSNLIRRHSSSYLVPLHLLQCRLNTWTTTVRLDQLTTQRRLPRGGLEDPYIGVKILKYLKSMMLSIVDAILAIADGMSPPSIYQTAVTDLQNCQIHAIDDACMHYEQTSSLYRQTSRRRPSSHQQQPYEVFITALCRSTRQIEHLEAMLPHWYQYWAQRSLGAIWKEFTVEVSTFNASDSPSKFHACGYEAYVCMMSCNGFIVTTLSGQFNDRTPVNYIRYSTIQRQGWYDLLNPCPIHHYDSSRPSSTIPSRALLGGVRHTIELDWYNKERRDFTTTFVVVDDIEMSRSTTMEFSLGRNFLLEELFLPDRSQSERWTQSRQQIELNSVIQQERERLADAGRRRHQLSRRNSVRSDG